MKLCLPRTEYIGEVFRCLCLDLNIDFVAAPKPGKYTLAIGNAFADGTLCEGLQAVLGSLAECYYLGADTAVFFAPCGNCSAQRIQAKLANCLQMHIPRLHLCCLDDDPRSQKAFWKMLRTNSPLSLFAFRQAKKEFSECLQKLEALTAAVRHSAENETARRYRNIILSRIETAGSLYELKLLFSLFAKRLAPLAATESEPEQIPPPLPYCSGDYFSSGTIAFESRFFAPKTREPFTYQLPQMALCRCF